MLPADRLTGVDLSLIRQINALATPLSLNLGIGEPNLAPDETLAEMARLAATASWRYTPNAGNLTLRELVVADQPFDPKAEVCITAGTEEALFAIFQAFVNPGDEVLVPNPGFVAYPTLARIAGATAVPYPIDPPAFQLEADSVVSRITPRTKLIVVNTPSNPLGSVVPREALLAIARAAEQHRCLVVSDEIYREIWYEAPPHSMIGMSRNVVVVNGMSKSHGLTGLRIGWAIADAAVMKPIVTAHQYIATCASAFSQTLAEAILSHSAWNAAWLEGVRDQFASQRDAALSAVSRELAVTLAPPAAAFYAFVPVSSSDTLSLAKELATRSGVLVIPGVAFGSRGEGFLRISYAAPVETIARGIERVGRALRTASR